MATEFCQNCKQAHPGRTCDYDKKGDCSETLTLMRSLTHPAARNQKDNEIKKDAG
jgi:hypothetical protein